MREDILELPKLIDIFLFSLSYLNSLKRIHSRIVKDVFFELKSFAQLIIDWGNRVDPKTGDYVLIDLGRKGIKQLDSFSQSPFPFQVAERILSEDFEGLFPIQK